MTPSSNTASNLQPTDSDKRVECEYKVRGILPTPLADLVLNEFPDSYQIQVDFTQSTDFLYRNEGINRIIVNHRNILTFRSQNFGACCGVQLLVDFYGHDSDFFARYFKIWISLTNIPHWAIFVKSCLFNSWNWLSLLYEPLSKQGKLVKEWRNPMYPDHLLCMYEFYNRERFEDFIEDIRPQARESLRGTL